MSGSSDRLRELLQASENEHLEVKEAKNGFHFEKLVKYCAALANEGGGSIVLGMTDKPPRKIVGSQAFLELERTKAGLVEKLRLRIDAQEIQDPAGRVLIFTAPPHPVGVPIVVDGAYWMRAGEDLAPMTQDMLRRIFAEAGPDFSAEVCLKATVADLDPVAIAELRRRWIERSRNQALARRSPQQLLRDAELVTEDGVTYAALILLGSRQALGQHLAQAEVIFEYRSSPRPGPANQRESFRLGFLLFYERLWELINLRNDEQHYQHGMVMRSLPTFSEGTVREALLNAVSHRDYRHPGSIFVRQYARRLEIVSPGGFPPGITPENILDRQLPRNRRIAETFARCGLIERSGQGVDRILEECVRQGKPLPDFSRSDAHQVWLDLHGEIEDVGFLRLLEGIGEERLASFDAHEFLILGLLMRDKRVPPILRDRASRLIELGVLERIARGKLRLSRRLGARVGPQADGSERQDHSRDLQKSRLLRLIENHGADGTPMKDLMAELPDLSRDQVRTLLRELRHEGKARPLGTTKTARWYPGA